MRLWCELAWLGAATADAGVLLDIEDDRIVDVHLDVPVPPADAEVLMGITIPGIANAHSHCFHRALRGRTQLGEGSFWTWREQMYAVAARLDPVAYRELAVGVFAEMVLAGYTAVGEFHYVHHQPDGTPYDDAHAMEWALIDAATEAGIRITLLDTCYLHGGPGDGTEPLPLQPEQLRFSDGSVDVWVSRASALHAMVGLHPTARVGAAIHSVRAVTPTEAAIVARWADLRQVPLHAHVSEQPAENDDCQRAYGMTPTSVLAGAGALWGAGGFCAVHATHLTPEDVSAYGSTGAYVCFCPTTERDLADGIGPSRDLVDAGAQLCVGSDSHAVLDAFEELRAVETDERLATGVRGTHSAGHLLLAGTANGMAAIGWPDAGMIAPGALADLVVVATDGIAMAGVAAQHALESVVFGAGPRDVTAVMVGGRWVVRDHLHIAVPDAARRLQAAVTALTSPVR